MRFVRASLAEDHGGSHAPFAAVVRGLHAVVREEGEQVFPVLAKPLGEAAAACLAVK